MERDLLRQRIVAHLAVVHSGAEARDLIRFGPKVEVEIFEDTVSELLSIKEEERLSDIQERIRCFIASEEFTGLADIHPAWLKEVLSKETPRIIGIILRYLPSNHVRYILNNLPRRLSSELPNIIDAFAVPTPVLKIIKRIFESHFIPMTVSKNIGEFGFEHISCLKSWELEELIKDMGIHELAMAVGGIKPRTLNVLLNRLTIKEANLLKERITALGETDPKLTKEARYSILEMSLEEMDAPSLLVEFGLNSLSKAIGVEDICILPVLRQKFSPRIGYILKRYIDLHIANPSNMSGPRKELVLNRIAALSKNGVIDNSWSRFFISQDDTSAIGLDKPDGEVMSWQPH